MIAKVGEVVVVGLGGSRAVHANIIERATRAVLGDTVLSDNSCTRPVVKDGVIVEGARFFIDGRKVRVFDTSVAFGPLERKIFEQPTKDVLEQFILSEYQRINTESSEHAATQQLLMPPIPRDAKGIGE